MHSTSTRIMKNSTLYEIPFISILLNNQIGVVRTDIPTVPIIRNQKNIFEWSSLKNFIFLILLILLILLIILLFLSYKIFLIIILYIHFLSIYQHLSILCAYFPISIRTSSKVRSKRKVLKYQIQGLKYNQC